MSEVPPMQWADSDGNIIANLNSDGTLTMVKGTGYKGPTVTLWEDYPSWTIKLEIRTQGGKVYAVSFAKEFWVDIVEHPMELWHYISTSFHKQVYDDADLYHALSMIRTWCNQMETYGDNKVLMASNPLSPFYQKTKPVALTPPPTDEYMKIYQETKAKFDAAIKKKYIEGSGPMAEVRLLPGLDEKVKHPVDGGMGTLRITIIHLNDTHKWTREQIADWLETLDVDIRFKPKEVTNEQD